MKKLILAFCLLTSICAAQDTEKEIEQMKIDSVNLGGKHIKPNKITCDNIEYTWERLEYRVLTAPATTITTTAVLNSNLDLAYKFLIYGYSAGAGTIFLKPNSVGAGTPYTDSSITSDGTTLSTSHTHQNNNGIAIGVTGVNYYFIVEGTYARIKSYSGGNLCHGIYNGTNSEYDANAVFVLQQRGGTFQIGTNITYFDITNSAAGGFDTGTVLELWVRR
jgi:hypothetical protein